MNDAAIPDQAKQFLLRHIDSIAQWEGLLLLRANPGEAWDVGAVARNLYISEVETAALLDRLTERGILARLDTPEGIAYRYQPVGEDLGRIVTELADLYRQYLIPITNLIHARPKSRVQEFANAFRIRKD